MADNDVRTCANEVCNCAVAEGDTYCSPSCEGAVESDVTELTCDCGHSGCAGDVAA